MSGHTNLSLNPLSKPYVNDVEVSAKQHMAVKPSNPVVEVILCGDTPHMSTSTLGLSTIHPIDTPHSRTIQRSVVASVLEQAVTVNRC